MNEFCVYGHYEDSGVCFYVGIGSSNEFKGA